MISINERIAEKKGWRRCGEIHLSSSTPGESCSLWRDSDGKHERLPDYTGDPVLSDGLLEEIRAKGYYVGRMMFPDGSDILKWCDIPEEWDSLTTSTGGAERIFSILCAEAWLAVFGADRGEGE